MFCHYFTAEFIIMLGEKSADLNEFKDNLAKNGAEFPVSYTLQY